MQSARDGVTTIAEFSAGVKNCENDFESWALLDRVEIDWDSTAVVDNADRSIFKEGDIDGVAVSGEGLINRVIDDFVNQVVESPLAG
jgi:hypothetical protein